MDIEIIKNANTKILGKNIIYNKVTDSTQKDAKDNINILPNGTIFLADIQLKGVGTHGRKWYTEGDNIALTILLYPDCKIDRLQGLTTQIASVIMNSIKDKYKIQLEIKEPNDLILNGKKIAGILTETALEGENVEYLLIGIGFNVNEIKFNEKIEKIATSLKNEFKMDFSREDIIKIILEGLEKELAKIMILK